MAELRDAEATEDCSAHRESKNGTASIHTAVTAEEVRLGTEETVPTAERGETVQVETTDDRHGWHAAPDDEGGDRGPFCGGVGPPASPREVPLRPADAAMEGACRGGHWRDDDAAHGAR